MSDNFEGSGLVFKYAEAFSDLGDESTTSLFTADSNTTSSITTININKSAISVLDISGYITAITTALSPNTYYIILQSTSNLNIFAFLNIISIVDNTDYFTISVTLVTDAHSGDLIDNDNYYFKIMISSVGAGGLGNMLKSVYDINDNGIVDNAALVNGLTVETAVPSGALFTDTDTTYTDAEIKTKLENNSDTNTLTDADKG